MRVGEKSNFDFLVISIKTGSGIPPVAYKAHCGLECAECTGVSS